MKKHLFLLIASCVAMLTARAEVALWPTQTRLLASMPEEVKVLSLNNSLIDFNGQTEMFNSVASAMGKNATWTKHSNLGQSLAYQFYDDPLIPDAHVMVSGDLWTHIVLQEYSSLARTDFAAFHSDVKLWVDYIHSHCPNPQVVIMMPINWAQVNDDLFQARNDTLIANFRKVAQEFGLVLCPVAVAFANYQKDHPSTFIKDLTRGVLHPNPNGSYLACCLEYAVIFDEDPTTITWKPETMDETTATTMREYAKGAYENFKQVVNQHTHTIHYEIHSVDSLGHSTALLQDAGFETFTEAGSYSISRTYDDLFLQSEVIMDNMATQMPVFPAISITEGTEYTEDFNQLGGEDVDPAPEEKTTYVRATMLPEGWRIDNNTCAVRTVRSYASADDATMYIGGQSLASRAFSGTWNFGMTGSTDRAVGGIISGSAHCARTINLMAHLRNDGESDLDSLFINYDVEKYRYGANEAGFAVQLFVSDDGTNWTNAGSDFCTTFDPDDTTIGAAYVPIATVNVSRLIKRTFASRSDLYLAWSISPISGTTCTKAPALAIDNITIRTFDPLVTSVSDAFTNPGCTKLLRDGKILILRDGKTYTIQGIELSK